MAAKGGHQAASGVVLTDTGAGKHLLEQVL